MDPPLPENLVPAWEEFLSKPRTPTDLFAHPLLFPLQRRREWDKMVEVVQGCDALGGDMTYMEIGADKGGSVWLWLHALQYRVKRCIVCEIRGTPYRDLFERAFPHVEFLWIPKGSQEPEVIQWVGDWLKFPQYKTDVLFIDGDKAHHGFYKDWQAYSPMVRKGGVVFVHDITDMYTDGPGRSWRRIVQTELVRHGDVNRLPEIIDRSEVEPALDKQKRGEPLTSHEEWLCHWKGKSCGVGVVHV